MFPKPGIRVNLLCYAALLPVGLAGQWKLTGPYGGSADLIRVSAKREGMLLAATRQGMVFQSLDGGALWTPLAFPRQLHGVVHALETDPQNADVAYAGMEDENPLYSGVYRTTDSGASWTSLAGLKGKAVWSLVLWPGDSHLLAAGTGDGVYLSEDGGEQWRKISPDENRDLSPVVSLAFHPKDRNTLYAGTTHLPWKTVDGGAAWVSIHSGMHDDSDVFSMQVDQHNPDVVFASACSGVYRSAGGGQLWRRLATPKGAFRAYLVAADPRRDGLIFAGTSAGLFRSRDGGTTWVKASPHAVKAIAFDPWHADRIYFASTTGGILMSADAGQTLREINHGFSNRNFTTISGAGGAVYASSVYEPGTGGLFRSDGAGADWKRVNDGDLAGRDHILLLSAVPANPEIVLAAGYHSLQKSADGGRTWVPLRTPGTDHKITALLALPGKPWPMLAATGAGIYRSLNAGLSWTRMSLESLKIHGFQSSGDTAVAALSEHGAFVSADAGSTWTHCGSLDLEAGWYGVALGTHAAALAATSHGLFRSADGCASWTPVRDGLEAGTVSIVTASPGKPDEFYATQYGRVFRSTDAGQHWSLLDPDLHDVVYMSTLLILPGAPERLFALLPRRGVLVYKKENL